MKTSTLLLLTALALTASSQAALVTNNFVQNQSVNWTQIPGAAADQSSTNGAGAAARAIDGNTNGAWSASSVTHTLPSDTNSYWEVDLGSARPITDITLFNRTDCCGNRLSNFSVLASNDPTFATTVWSSGNQAGAVGVSAAFAGVGVTAQYVRIQRDGLSTGGESVISLAEVEVNGAALYNFSNLATGSSANQSSTLVNAASPSADQAIDGDLTNSFGSGSTTHTNPGAGGAVFWETTLTSLSSINEIALYNRGDCCPDRLSNFRVSIFDGASEVWGEDYFTTAGDAGSIFSIQEDAGGFFGTGDRVRIELIGGTNNAATGTDVLSLREVEIYGIVIPEPSSGLLAALGFALILRRRRAE